MKKETKDFLVVGAALFAMFFGAGNLIFPPALGALSGDQWLLSILGFAITGVGLPILGGYACVHRILLWSRIIVSTKKHVFSV